MTEVKKENKELFLKVPKELLKLTHIPSRIEVDISGKPVMVEFSANDKLIYLTMKNRFDHFKSSQKPNSIGSSYYDSHGDVASMCGVSLKTVTRFIKKWKTHGYIDYVNYAGNRANYTMFEDIPTDGTPTILVAKGVVEIPEEQEYFASRSYVDPEDDTLCMSYGLEVICSNEPKKSVSNDFDNCPF